MTTDRVLGWFAVLVLAITLQGCTRQEVVLSAKAKVTDMVCDDAVAGSVKQIEETAVAMLEKMCEGTRNHSDIQILPREEQAKIEDECLGEGAGRIMERLSEGRHELEQRCDKYVLQKLDDAQGNATNMVNNLWKKAKEFAAEWASRDRSERRAVLQTDTFSQVSEVRERMAEVVEERRQEQKRRTAIRDTSESDASGDALQRHEGDAAHLIARQYSLLKHFRSSGSGPPKTAVTMIQGVFSAVIIAGAALIVIGRNVSRRSTQLLASQASRSAQGEESVPFVDSSQIVEDAESRDLMDARAQVEELEDRLRGARFKLRWQELKRVVSMDLANQANSC